MRTTRTIAAIMAACGIGSATLAQTAPAQPEESGPVVGRQGIVDIDRLIKIVDDATVSVAEPVVSSQLSERFNGVITILRSRQVDKDQLVAALGALESELTTFTNKLDSTPLLDAQEAIGETIDKVRLLMATGPSGKPNREVMIEVEKADEQLRALVRLIDREADPQRQDRLKLQFQHQLRVRNLKEQMSRVTLGDTKLRVFMKTVQALDMLSTQLLSAGFKVEEARVVLAQQRDFIKTYRELVYEIGQAERLADTLRGLGTTGSKLQPMIADLVQIAQQAREFEQLMNEVGEGLIAEIEMTADKLTFDLEETAERSRVDIEAELQKYREPAGGGR